MKNNKKNKWLAWLLLTVITVVTLVGCGVTVSLDDTPSSPDYTTQKDVQVDKSEGKITADNITLDNPTDNKSNTDNTTADSQTAKPENTPDNKQDNTSTTEPEKTKIDENGTYSDKEQVALYIHVYGHLPSNYITKNEAEALGWKDKGTLDKLAPGKSIGGDKFGNREGLLPKANGRQYFECDIDYVKGNRNGKRIIYSNDGLIFYTEDHYASFTQLY